MKIILFVILIFTSTAFANEDWKQISFLQGCWKGTTGNSTVHENWGNSDGQMMVGASKTVSEGSIESFEFLAILPIEGKIHYVPYVNGTKSVSFALTQSSPTGAEFSNPAHDFPKMIRYELQGSRLMIRLTGDGPNIAYSLYRVSCTTR